MTYPTNRLSMQCPQCGQPVTMTAQQVIDVGEDPTLRDRLLRGRVNVLSCPHCGVKGPIALPMVYHDPNHELLLAFLPNEMQLTMEQEEREVGRLTNMVLNNTPPEKRKGYLLNPTRVMSYDGLMEKIMEAEGVSPDEMRKQTERIRLLMQMAQMVGNDERLSALIEQNKGEVDKNFLTLIAATMAQAQEMGDEETVKRYRTLQQKLVQQLNLKASDLPTFDATEQYDALIEALLTTEPERLQTLVAANRPLLDYGFFMHLTQRAEAADAPTKQQLLALRKQIVQMTDEMDQRAEQAMRKAAEQLQTLLQAPDIDAKIQEMYNDLDEAFLVVLSANLEQAEAQGRGEIVSVLRSIYERVVMAMEKRLRPELRAMNELLRMDSAAEREARLRQELQLYNPAGFIEMIEAIAGDLEDAGRADPATLDRLYTIADEARELAATMDFAPPTEKLFEEAPTKPSGLILTPEEERRRKQQEGPGIVLPGKG